MSTHRTRGLAGAVLIALALTGASCGDLPAASAAGTARQTGAPIATSTSDGAHWHSRDGLSDDLERTVLVVLQSAGYGNPEFRDGVLAGMEAWNDATPYARFVPIVGTGCPADRHCVLVGREPTNGAVTWSATDAYGRMFRHGVTILFDTAAWDPAVLVNGACHEFGHALGLGHSDIDGVAGPCDNGRPTVHDLKLVASAYRQVDPIGQVAR